MAKLKMWIGNLDGRREGLVIAVSKAQAMKIAGVGRKDFDDYWSEQAEVDETLKIAQLYTRWMNSMAGYKVGSWTPGLVQEKT